MMKSRQEKSEKPGKLTQKELKEKRDKAKTKKAANKAT